MGSIVGTKKLHPVRNDDVSSDVLAHLLGAWRQSAQDPDDQPEQWLQSGGPAGIRLFPAHRGIFPLYSETEDDPNLHTDDPEMLHSDPMSFNNYAGVETDTMVAQELDRFVASKWVKIFASLDC